MKQETLEEAAERLYPKEKYPTEFMVIRKAFISNLKQQQERSYSDEEVKFIISEALQSALVQLDLEQWFKQFKKK